MRNVEAINIDCLTPHYIKSEQDKQPKIQMIKQWKRDGRKPDWSQIAQYGPELKSLLVFLGVFNINGRDIVQAETH